MMPLNKIVGLQGPLKELSKENYARLKHSLLKHGFAFPLNVATINGKPYGVIDGHQRHKVIEKMLTEGFTLSGNKLPVTLTSCKSHKQAKELILQAVSQYGKITEDGLSEFLALSNLDLNDLAEYDLPDFDLDDFLASQGFDVGKEPKGSANENKSRTVTCPECGHEW